MEDLEMKREDGTLVGTFCARSEGKPVSEVLNLLHQIGQHGMLLNGNRFLTDTDLLTPGRTYTFRPVTHAPSLVPQGREEGLISQSVLTAFEQLHSKLNHMFGLLEEPLSRTRAASTIIADNLRILRHCLGVSVIPEEEGGVTLAALLGAETEGGVFLGWGHL